MSEKPIFSYKPGLDGDHTKGRFDGEVVVVCGGVSGIGRATVERFVNDGAHVAILDVNSDYEAFDDEVGSFVSFYKVDCSNRDQCFENVEKIGKKFGKINHLVYSVAYFGSKTYQATEEDWSKSLMINTAGAGFMISALDINT